MKNATEVVTDLYRKFPKVEFIDERDLGEDIVGLMFEYRDSEVNEQQLKELLDSYGNWYRIRESREFYGGKSLLVKAEDDYVSLPVEDDLGVDWYYKHRDDYDPYGEPKPDYLLGEAVEGERAFMLRKGVLPDGTDSMLFIVTPSNRLCIVNGKEGMNDPTNTEPLYMQGEKATIGGWEEELDKDTIVSLYLHQDGIVLDDADEDDWYYGKEEADKYKDLILDNLSGKKISKNRYLAKDRGGIVYEAEKLGIGTFELLRALEGGCYQGWVKEIDDSTYRVMPSGYSEYRDQGDLVLYDGPLKESSGKVYVVKTLQDYPYNGWVELMDKVDKNGEGEKHRFTDRDEVRKYAQELADQGYSNWQGYPSAEKKPANTKINIRESLNKYDLRTDNKYDLRNLYDACIMTDKEKRIIAEMISKNTRANVLYEALMNKFEGRELKESLDQEQVEDTKAYVYEQVTHRPNLTRDGHIEIDEYHFEDMVNDALDYEDCTEEEAQAICEELKKLIEGIKYYRDSWKLYIELSDNRTLWDIDVPDGVSDAEVESVYEMMLGVSFDDFQEETGVDLTLLGRSGRHVCVDNTYENAKRYSELVSVQKEVEDRFIKNVNNELRSPNEEEYESLKEADERNADLDKGIKDEQETINLYDKMSKKKVFNGVEKDQIKEIRNDEKDHKRLLKKIKDGKLTRVEEAYDDADLLSSCKEKYRRLIDIADSAGDFSSIKEVITAMYDEVGGKVRFEEVSRRYASFSGSVKGHSLWNSVSLEYEQADLHRLAEDLTMAFYRTNGGQGYNTYTLMDAIRGDSKNESLKEAYHPGTYKVRVYNIDYEIDPEDAEYALDLFWYDEDPEYEQKINAWISDKKNELPKELILSVDSPQGEDELDYVIEDAVEDETGWGMRHYKYKILERPQIKIPDGFKEFDGYATEVEVGSEVITYDGEHFYVTDYSDSDRDLWVSRNRSDISKNLGRSLDSDEVQFVSSYYGESLKEDVNDRLRQIAEPLANALDDLTDRDDGFYITYSIGMDDNGAVTGGVDFELFKSSRTEEEAKAEIERVFDENGFELDRRFKTNPGKTLFGRTHYQIIEKDK